jgi:ferredoxin--NADP+ reductase
MFNMSSVRVLENVRISEKTFRLRVERTFSTIRAGQCFSLGTSDLGINREYSMYSGASEDYLDFLIREVDDGIVSTRLSNCVPGDLVEVSGPFGEFCLKESDAESQHFVFLATGTGIAPFHSYVKTFPELKFLLVHGVRFDSELYDASDYPHSSFIPAVSQPENGTGGRRLTEVISGMDLPRESLFYLCGNQKMIVDAIKILREKHIPGGSIFTETFF